MKSRRVTAQICLLTALFITFALPVLHDHSHSCHCGHEAELSSPDFSSELSPCGRNDDSGEETECPVCVFVSYLNSAEPDSPPRLESHNPPAEISFPPETVPSVKKLFLPAQPRAPPRA